MTFGNDCRLGDLGTWVSGGTPKTSEDSYWGGELPWMSSKSLTEFYVRDSDRRLTDEGSRNGTRVVPTGTILMVVRGMSLKTEFRMGIAQQPVALSQDLKGLIVREDLDALFVAYALKSASSDVLAMVDEAGHGTGRLQTDRLFDLRLPVPSLDEQRAIAATLGALDDKIESNRRATFSTYELVDAIAEKLGEELPTVELRDVAVVRKETAKPSTMGDDIVAHYSLPAFDGGATPDLVAASTIMSNKSWIRSGSVLVSRLNPRIDRSWWVQDVDGAPSISSTEFAVLEPASKSTLAGVWLAVRDPFFRSELPRRVTGTSGSHQRVRPEDMLSIEVPDVRQADAELLRTVHELMAGARQLADESVRLSALRDALLPELLSGRIRATPEELVSA